MKVTSIVAGSLVVCSFCCSFASDQVGNEVSANSQARDIYRPDTHTKEMLEAICAIQEADAISQAKDKDIYYHSSTNKEILEAIEAVTKVNANSQAKDKDIYYYPSTNKEILEAICAIKEADAISQAKDREFFEAIMKNLPRISNIPDPYFDPNTSSSNIKDWIDKCHLIIDKTLDYLDKHPDPLISSTVKELTDIYAKIEEKRETIANEFKEFVAFANEARLKISKIDGMIEDAKKNAQSSLPDSLATI
jgi:hypothetical protein